MNIICIIPARKGSKGVKNKNIKLLQGKPLIQHSIDFANATGLFNRIIISSDSQEIIDFCQDFDVLAIPRPKALSEDNSLVIDAIRYTIDKYEKDYKEKIDFIFLLEPTSPIRFKDDFEKAVEFLKAGADSVASFALIDPPPHRIWRIENDKIEPFIQNANPFLPRQVHESGYVLTGQIYGFSKDLVMEKQNSVLGPNLKPIFIADGMYIDIDHEIDFYIAESKLKYINYINYENN